MDWEARFSVGIPELDQDHQFIVHCIDRLEHAVEHEHRWLEIHSSLRHLLQYSDRHFRLEEALMRITAYPRFEEHSADHRSFLARINELHGKWPSAQLGRSALGYLRGYVDEHIMGHDKQYADYALAKFDGQNCPR